MYNKVHRTEKNIRKILQDDTAYKQEFVEAAQLYRDVSYTVSRAEEVRRKIYPEIKNKFDEIFNDQDKILTRVVQIGNLLITLSKDSVTTSENVEVQNILTQLKSFLPEYAELIDKVFQRNMEMARIQVNPSLYVLDKNTSNKDVLSNFMESKFSKFRKQPNLVTLNESHKLFSYDELKAKGVDIMKQVVTKLTPLMNKMSRAIRSIVNKSEELVSKYNIDVAINKFTNSTDVVQETKEVADNNVENPHIKTIKRLSTKATASIDPESVLATELKGLIEEYDAVGDIANRAMELKKQVSDEIKDEVLDLFTEQERSLNSVIDLGEVIVAVTGSNYTRAGRAETVMKNFIEELKTLLPEVETTIEAIYRMNKSLTEVPRKSTIKSKVTEDIIQRTVDFIERIQRFITKSKGILQSKNRVMRNSIKQLKDKLNNMDVVVEQLIKEEQINNPSHYCVLYPDIAIFGVGKSEEDAWKDAEKWADTTQPDWKKHMQVKPCTSDVYDSVKANGSPDKWNIVNKTVTL